MQWIANPSTSVRLRDAPPFYTISAQVVESVDTRDLKSLGRKAVRVQVPLWAPLPCILYSNYFSVCDLFAQVVESVDTRDLKSLGGNAVRVQVPLWAPMLIIANQATERWFFCRYRIASFILFAHSSRCYQLYLSTTFINDINSSVSSSEDWTLCLSERLQIAYF